MRGGPVPHWFLFLSKQFACAFGHAPTRKETQHEKSCQENEASPSTANQQWFQPQHSEQRRAHGLFQQIPPVLDTSNTNTAPYVSSTFTVRKNPLAIGTISILMFASTPIHRTATKLIGTPGKSLRSEFLDRSKTENDSHAENSSSCFTLNRGRLESFSTNRPFFKAFITFRLSKLKRFKKTILLILPIHSFNCVLHATILSRKRACSNSAHAKILDKQLKVYTACSENISTSSMYLSHDVDSFNNLCSYQRSFPTFNFSPVLPHEKNL